MHRLNRNALLAFQVRPVRALLAGVVLMAYLAGSNFLAAHDAAQKDTTQENTAEAVAASMVVAQDEQAVHQHDRSEGAAMAMTADTAAMPHEHTGSIPTPGVVRLLLLLTFAIAAALMYSARRSLRPGAAHTHAQGSDLLQWPVIGKLLRWRHFPALLIAPSVFIFTFIVFAGLFGEQNTSNPAILLTWILWWPAIIFTFILLGRIWCVACPFGWMGDLAQKIFSFQLQVPKILKNMWWRMGLFLALTWATTLWALDRWPFGTAWLGLVLTLGAVTLAVIYQKRTFCRYVCPLGGIFGLYAMTAPVRIGVKDKQLCQQECPHKDCYQSCAWFEFAPTLDRNAECNLCLDCVRACPYDNITLQAQSFGADLMGFHSHRKSLDEASTVAAVLGVALLQTVVMLNARTGWEAAAGRWLGMAPGPVLYTLIFVTLGLIVPVLLVGLVSYLGAPREEFRGDVFRAFRTYAYAFLPLGLGLHAAHNFHHLFGEGGAMWTGVKNAVAQYTGWEALASASPAASAFSIAPNTLFTLQWLALVSGLFLAFRVGVAVVRRNTAQSRLAFRTALPIMLFAIAYTVLNIIVLSAPMAHRH